MISKQFTADALDLPWAKATEEVKVNAVFI
jgi:hypothetical protein